MNFTGRIAISAIRVLFVVSFLYDGLLGLAFLVAGPSVFTATGITPPNHWGYVHFAAGLLLVFAWMFLQIARNPLENRGLIVYGALLKACYVLTVLWHATHGGVPPLWVVFAVMDAGFFILFVAAHAWLRTFCSNRPPSDCS